MNHYFTSNGERVTEATIKQRRSRAYRELYAHEPFQSCAGCGLPATSSMHLIPQSICKSNRLTELVWSHENILPACHKCNQTAEAPKGDGIRLLNCYPQILEITRKYLPERYEKMI